jgi:hypothetical protein
MRENDAGGATLTAKKRRLNEIRSMMGERLRERAPPFWVTGLGNAGRARYRGGVGNPG